MRIYFGRVPEGDDGDAIESLDELFLDFLIKNDYNIVISSSLLVHYLMNNWDNYDFKDVILHTINPLLINYFDDDFAKKYLWIIDGEGNHINMGKDEHMLSKMDVLGPGEVFCDDYRTFKG